MHVRVTRDEDAPVYLAVDGPAEPRRPPLLVLDGVGCVGWTFRQVIPDLAAERRVALLHYRGHGRSPTPQRPWRLGIHELADDASAAIEEVSLAPAVVVGFSMGFQVALELYRRHREKVAALVSIAGPSGRTLAGLRGNSALGGALPILQALTRGGREWTERLWRHVIPSRSAQAFALSTQVDGTRIAPDDFRYYARQLGSINPELFVDMLAQAHRHCADDVLEQIHVPTLVIAGGRDGFIPVETLRAMAFRIPAAQWVVFPNATHALAAEYPHELAARLQAFVHEVEGAEADRGPARG